MNPRVVQFYFPISGTLFIPIDSLTFGSNSGDTGRLPGTSS